MKENYQVNDGLYKCDVTSPLSKKMYIGLAEREVSLITSYHLNKIDIPIRQHFQVTCCA